MAKTTTQQQTSKKKTLREKAEKQKKATVKSVLQTPFKTSWPSISFKKQQEILEYLERLLQPFDDVNLKSIRKMKNSEESKECNDLVEKIRSELVIGVNDVTKMLEKNKLSLVLVCKSANPPIIVKHLAELSSVRCCPAMQLDGLNRSICFKLKLHSAVAVGFKKIKDGYFHEFIAFVNPPEIRFPYLNNDTAKFVIDKKGSKMSEEHFSYGNRVAQRHRHHVKYINRNPALPVTFPADTGMSKFCPQKEPDIKLKKVEGQEANPFRSNENFISLSSVSDDEDLQGLDLKFRHTNTRDHIWQEIFDRRICNELNSRGMRQNDVNRREAAPLKLFSMQEGEMQTNRLVFDDKKAKDFSKGGSRKKRNSNPVEGMPEYRMTEVKRIKGNIDKKKKKKKKKELIEKQNGGVNEAKKCPKEKSHLNKKNKSKLKKLKKALKKLNNLKS